MKMPDFLYLQYFSYFSTGRHGQEDQRQRQFLLLRNPGRLSFSSPSLKLRSFSPVLLVFSLVQATSFSAEFTFSRCILALSFSMSYSARAVTLSVAFCHGCKRDAEPVIKGEVDNLREMMIRVMKIISFIEQIMSQAEPYG